jgi:DNA-binding CsgD family transcriptional regulator
VGAVSTRAHHRDLAGPADLAPRGGPDFAERDRLLLARLAPHLAALVTARTRPPAALTRRQHELLRLVAAGHSSAEVVAALGVTESTVRKHLEHIYGRLGVRPRTAAVAAVFGPGI